MNISDASTRAGLPAKTIRYYEDIGLVTPARDTNGYRDFSGSDVHTLTFLARARALGFSIDDCRTLLALYADKSRASSEVKKVAEEHLEEIERKIADLVAMRDTLSHLVRNCHGDDRPDCPILDEMGGSADA
jgi:Cu(I)-responsive transcriptional regulator